MQLALDTIAWVDELLISVSHWLFAVEYLKLHLRFPLLLFELKALEYQSRKRKNSCLLYGLNTFFFTLISVYAVLQIYCSITGNYYFIVFVLAFLAPLVGGLLLLFAIYRI